MLPKKVAVSNVLGFENNLKNLPVDNSTKQSLVLWVYLLNSLSN